MRPVAYFVLFASFPVTLPYPDNTKCEQVETMKNSVFRNEKYLSSQVGIQTNSGSISFPFIHMLVARLRDDLRHYQYCGCGLCPQRLQIRCATGTLPFCCCNQSSRACLRAEYGGKVTRFKKLDSLSRIRREQHPKTAVR